MDKYIVRWNGHNYGPFDSYELARYWIRTQNCTPGTYTIEPLIGVA